MSKASALVRLIRPVNCVMMGFAVIVGAALVGRETFIQQLQSLLFGFSTGFFLTGATMAINDYHDRKIDAVNEPRRPIPSGVVSPNEALTYATGLTIIGFLTAWATNLQCLAIALIAWLIFVLYTTVGKRTGFLGNLMVSTCIAIPFIYGSFVAGVGPQQAVGVFVTIVFLSNTGREVTKGIVDVQGDRTNDIGTVAVLYGEQRAAAVAAALYLSAIALTPLPLLWGIVSFWFVPFVVLTDMGLVLSSVSIVLNPSRENARRIKNRNLLWFSTGMLAFIAGAF